MLVKSLKEFVINTSITPLIWGAHGIGKSQIAYQLVDVLSKETAKEWGIVELRIGTQELSDLIGIPKIRTVKVEYRDSETKETIKDELYETDWTNTSWFPSVYKVEKRLIPENGIVFLDEINRGGMQETQALFQFVLDRRLHTHLLAPGWKIIAAANPPSDEYLVNDFDDALMDRFCHLELYPSVDDWLIHASDNEFDESIVEYINVQRDMLFIRSKNTSEIIPKINPSPRAWEMLSVIRKKCEFPQEILMEVYAGLVGPTAAASYMSFIRNNYDSPVMAKEIMKNYDKVENKIKLAVKNNKLDQINLTIKSLISYCGDENNEFSVENFYRFWSDIPRDLRVTILLSLIEFDHINILLNSHDELIKEITRMMERIRNQDLTKKVII
ncbi:AAA family ATPase [Wukongibacter baidiensis]